MSTEERSSPPVRPARVVAGSALAAGSLLAIGGAVAAARARDASHDYAAAPLGTPAEVDAAEALHGRAEQRIRAARGLLGSAGALVAAGLGAWLWSSTRPERASRAALALRSIEAEPLARGALLSWRGTWGEAP